jgi:hypothetical protein
MPQTIFVKQNTRTLESFFEAKTIVVKNKIHTITVYDSPVRYVEPFIYVDGGMYDQEGTFVDAGLYDTTVWTDTWNGGYA